MLGLMGPLPVRSFGFYSKLRKGPTEGFEKSDAILLMFEGSNGLVKLTYIILSSQFMKWYVYHSYLIDVNTEPWKA